jgi:glycosyltransferase involved in cell wall biosynthesis
MNYKNDNQHYANNRAVIIGIDASNIRGGGGVTHLVELLQAADPLLHGFSQIILWGGEATLSKIEGRSWLIKTHIQSLDNNLIYRSVWQRFKLSNAVRAAGCDVLFVPGGIFAGDFRPIVTMNRNLLPFDLNEFLRYGLSWMTFKMLLLRWLQSRTLRKAESVIFLTQYAQKLVSKIARVHPVKSTIIPHGVNNRFQCMPRTQLAIQDYSFNRPFRIVYISVVDKYKHQWHVVNAVAKLRASGLPVVLELVGPSHSSPLSKLKRIMEKVDPNSRYIHYLDFVTYEAIKDIYASADLNVFASSCEAFGQILVEAMSSGLPIACSNRSSMPEVLGNAGLYFDPENPDDIAKALRMLIESPELRFQKAKLAFDRAQEYTWHRCAFETFGVLTKTAQFFRSNTQ